LVHHQLDGVPTMFSKALRYLIDINLVVRGARQEASASSKAMRQSNVCPMNLENRYFYLITGPARLPAMVIS
jgi:hypothetical protein